MKRQLLQNRVLSKTFVGLALASAPNPAISGTNQQKARPNVIFILADDMGYGDLGCYGQEKIETPNIDNLAKEGLRFNQFYAGAPLSSPSRCSLLTGLHTGHSFIRGNDELESRGDVNSHEAMYKDPSLEGQRPMPTGTMTFPLMFKQAGYTTACIGKWGLGYPGSEGAPEHMGYDFFYGYNCQRQAHNYYPPFLYRNENREYLPNRIYQPGEYEITDSLKASDEYYYDRFNEGKYSPDLMYDEIASYLEKNNQKPFLLSWTTTIPHMGLQAPDKWVKYYHNKFGAEKPYLGNDGYYPSIYPRATYAAMISTLDEQVGKLVSQLKKLGIYDQTIIVFTSDNGSANKGGPDPDWFKSGGQFKAGKGWGKGTLHEGGIRVPLIVVWPNHIKASATSDMVCAAWDFLPTFCDLMQLQSPITDGISILPELLGNKQAQHEYLYWEYPASSGSKAVRWGKWKALLRKIKSGNESIELYNLYIDPGETNNVADKNPKIVEKIRKMMDDAHSDSPIKSFQF